MEAADRKHPGDRERPCIVEDGEHFDRRYAAASQAGPLAVELHALGTDYRATGYTTREQADELGRLLELTPGDVLLDLGAGCGWPGLYLSSNHGCMVISTDTVIEGSITAHDRILRDRLADRAMAIVATGDDLPIRPGSIDAVVHTDVMC